MHLVNDQIWWGALEHLITGTIRHNKETLGTPPQHWWSNLAFKTLENHHINSQNGQLKHQRTQWWWLNLTRSNIRPSPWWLKLMMKHNKTIMTIRGRGTSSFISKIRQQNDWPTTNNLVPPVKKILASTYKH